MELLNAEFLKEARKTSSRLAGKQRFLRAQKARITHERVTGKNFRGLKSPLRKRAGKPQSGRTCKNASDKGLASRIHRELVQLSNKNKHLSKQNRQKIATDTLPPPHNTRMANKPLKRRLQPLVVRETRSKATRCQRTSPGRAKTAKT